MGQQVESTNDSPRPAMASPWKSQRPKKSGAVNGTPEQKQEATATSVSKPTLVAEQPQPKAEEKHRGKEQSEAAVYGPILRPRRPKAAPLSNEEKSTKADKKSPSKTKNSPVKPSSKPQTPHVSPPKEENETVVLQRNAENKYITKRRKEHKAKKHASSKQTPVVAGQKKSTPSSSKIGRNTPAPREASTRKRRLSTNETESKAKRQKSKITPESLDV
ncbi:hypothetical protein KEM55_003009 [Ascosphaera atra]|nr:hypothetical protein KEM55_003009 [Ascosphaera atra]